MIYSGIFNSVNGDRKINAWWIAKYFSTFIGNGVFPNPSTNLQVVEGTNMQVIVKPGSGWIDGYFLSSDSDYALDIELADGVLKRIDRIVMRLNHLTRQIEIDVKKGTFASTPVAPKLQRDGNANELALADVYVANGATQITQAHITDTRLSKDLCGIVHGTVDQVDTTTLYNQYLTFWNVWRQEKVAEFEQFQVDSQTVFDTQTNENQQTFDTQYQNNQQAFESQTAMNQQEFDAWFAAVQGILEGDVAGNLLSLIEKNELALDNHKNNMAQHNQFLVGSNTKMQMIFGFNAELNCMTVDFEEVVE